MATTTVTVRNGQNGPDYDALVDDTPVDGVTGVSGITIPKATRVDTPVDVTPANGGLVDLETDKQGRLRIAAANEVSEILGTITANAQTVVLPVPVASAAVIALSGTYTSVAVSFETSYDGGSTWVATSGVSVLSLAIVSSSGTLSNSNQAYRFSVEGATHIRVRATSYTSGTMNVAIRSLNMAAGSPIVANVPQSNYVGPIQGTVAIDSPMTAVQPLVAGGRASTAVPTAMSADNDMQALWMDRSGAAVTIAHERPFRVAVTPTISNTIYAALEQVGTVMTFTGAGLAVGRGGLVTGATLTDRDKIKASLQLWLFQVSPTIASVDNGAFDLTDANLEAAQWIGCIDFLNANYRDSASNSACYGQLVGTTGEGFRFSSSGASGALYGVLVTATGQTPTYVTTTSLVCSLFGIQH